WHQTCPRASAARCSSSPAVSCRWPRAGTRSTRPRPTSRGRSIPSRECATSCSRVSTAASLRSPCEAMRLAWGPEEEAFRAELDVFLDTHAPKQGLGLDFAASEEEGIPQWARDWQATLFDHGWMVPGSPPELGGRNATPVQTLVFMETLAERGVLRSVHFPGYAIVAPSLLDFGTDEQRAMAPAAIRGDTIWCIGMSEPNAGSDLAGLTTRAEVFDDRFVVNGQKVWTSYAMIAQKCFCYVRTDPTLPKHKGISLLILDMDTPGIDIRPLRHLNGTAGFAEVFFTDVEVPRSGLVGELNGGWGI